LLLLVTSQKRPPERFKALLSELKRNTLVAKFADTDIHKMMLTKF